MNHETDERIRLKGHGFGRELAVNPAYDGIRPKTRVDNRAVYDESSVGSFGAASEKITTMSQRHVAFDVITQSIPTRQVIVGGAGSITGMAVSVVATGNARIAVELWDGRTNSRIYQCTLGTTAATTITMGDNHTVRFGDWGISFNDLTLVTWSILGSATEIIYQGGTVSIANTE